MELTTAAATPRRSTLALLTRLNEVARLYTRLLRAVTFVSPLFRYDFVARADVKAPARLISLLSPAR
jgi:hypothetical protein